MKICHITSYLPKYHKLWGGAEIAVCTFMKVLYENKQENIVISVKPIKKVEEPYFTFYYAKTSRDYLGFWLSAGITSLIPFDFIAYFSIKKKLKEIDPDVVHLHNFGPFTPSIVCAIRKMKMPIVFSAYDYWSICPVESLINYKGDNCKFSQSIKCWRCISRRKLGFLRIFFLPLRNSIFGNMIKKINEFNVLSETWSEPLKKIGINEKRINVVPLPLPGGVYPPKKIPSDNTIIFIGWIEKRKGLEVVVKAMRLVRDQFKDARLYVIGSVCEEGYKNRIIQFIKENKLEKNILFLDKKSHKETLCYLDKSFISVVPEQWEIAWPIALTEAMAFEKPIVASRIGGIPGFIKNEENGFLVNPKSYEEFADKIIFFMKNRKRAIEMGKKARKTIVGICDNKKVFKNLINAYSKATEDEQNKR